LAPQAPNPAPAKPPPIVESKAVLSQLQS